MSDERLLRGFERLSPVKQKLLLARLRRQEEVPAAGPAAPAVAEIPPSPLRATGGPYPLSFSQQRLWFVDRLEPGNPAFNLPDAVRLTGRLDAAALAWALSEVVRRHEALRTVFEMEERRPVQRVLPPAPVPLRVIDLTGLPAGLREAETLRIAREEARAPFDVPAGPHLRARLLRLADEDGRGGHAEHVALFTTHHIVSDAWSMGVLIREVSALYAMAASAADAADAAGAGGRPAPDLVERAGLPALPIQYPDFADWQRRALAGEPLERLLAFWRGALAGAPQVLELPADRPRPPLQTMRGASREAILPAPLAARLAALASSRGATPFMTLLAGFAVLLSRHTGQEDLLIGAPIAGRTSLAVEGLIGFFVNTLVLRADLSDPAGDLSFDGLLARVREMTLAAYAHADLPFERLVEELQPARDLARPPLYQVALSLQNVPGGTLELPGLTLAPLVLAAETAQVELSVEVAEIPEGMLLNWRYKADLFDAATVLRLAGQLGVLLAAAAGEPGRPLADLPIFADGERHQLVAEWSDGGTAARPAAAGLIHQAFEAHAASDPSALALLRGDGERMSYGELDRRANRLAHRLAALGVGPEVRVGVLLERSLEAITSLLAVLKAGGAYVPLDPTYPRERLAWMVEDARPAVLLVSAATESILAAVDGTAPARLRIDLPGGPAAAEEWAGDEERPPRAGTSPDNLAYVIYTSGSTGRPKGVAVPHRGVVNTLAEAHRVYGLGPGVRLLQSASLSFDASVVDIFASLGAGACLCLLPPGPIPSGADMIAELRRLAIQSIHVTPSVLATLEDDVPHLTTIIAAGEACPAALARRWSVGKRLWNVYGPTEASVFVTSWLAPGPDFPGEPSLGRPIPHVRAYVLHGIEPAPVGVPGELALGGASTVRGYLGRPGATAASFVPDPFAGVEGARFDPGGAPVGARLYRTGDLVRWRPDGDLEFLGRIDRQVKVRGFRIELGEVEAAVAAHPAVASAAVTVQGSGPGAPRLVAYVVPRVGEEERAQPAALRSWVRERLPEFMVPSVFLALPELPLGSSGKIDRAALPDPDASRPDAGVAFIAPRAGLESTLAEIWCEVLKLERVGAEDVFFDLGGHSLLLVEVQSRIRERLGEELALLDLFRHPSVTSLAGFLAERRAAGSGESPAPVDTPQRPRRARAADDSEGASRDIAVLGMAGRFPGAPDLEQFWRNLRDGVESISFFTREELDAAGVAGELRESPGFVPAGGVLENADHFDAPFFDVSPREAQIMDPQQRLFLETAAEALERAGYGAGSPGARAARTGVFAGASISSYALQHFAQPGALASGSALEITLGNDKDYIAARIAYKLDLKGPAVAVQTACSTSLVAVHFACKSLLDGECDLAVAGGVGVEFPQVSGYLYQTGGVSSADGHNRAFDARASGTVGGNGVGAVVLKPLAAALADGDPVRAVIRATAINNDGAGKAGFTTPSELGQAEVIAEAQALAGVPPATVRYVEAHGTATPIGDPIEVAGLARAFREGGAGDLRAACALGSVKTNIGHTGSAAGVAGLIKTVLALEHRQIPPSLHFASPNPAIDFAATPFYVNTALVDWQPAADAAPRRAGVSSFGLGGTNAHAVVEEAPPRESSGPAREWQLLSLSARTEDALEAATDRLVEHLRRAPAGEAPAGPASAAAALADVAFTLHVGRKAYERRRAVVCRDRADAAEALASRDPRRVLGWTVAPGAAADRPVAFLLSGLGEQYPGLARGLYQGEAGFRERFDRCAGLFAPELGLDLAALMFAGPQGGERGAGSGPDLRRMLGRAAPAAAPGPLDRTAVLQPALFALEWALAGLWMEWGVVPRALIGYSLGEYVAACLAGVMSLEDAVRLVAARARLIDALPEGAMLAVSLPEPEVAPHLGAELSLAAVNGPSTSVVAGEAEKVAELEARLAAAGIPSRRLRTTHAFHSHMMEPAAASLAELARGMNLAPPRIPLLSNVTGTWLSPQQAVDPGYWAEHLRRPVRFSEGLGELWREPGRVLLEVGPGQSLATLALQHEAAEGIADPLALGSLPSAYERRPDLVVLLDTLGKLWLSGVAVDWRRFYGRERRRRVELPTYPWERRRYWLEPARPLPGAESTGTAVPQPAAPRPLVHLPAWRRTSPLPEPAPEEVRAGSWLVLAEGPGGPGGLGARIAGRLRREGARVAVAFAGERFARLDGPDGTDEIGGEAFTLDPRREEDYGALLGTFGEIPARVVHLWSLGAPAGKGGQEGQGFARAQDLGFYSLLSLARALAARAGQDPAPLAALRAAVVASGRERVTGTDPLRPELAPLGAVCRVLPRELPGAVCREIDLAPPALGNQRGNQRGSQRGSWREERLAAALIAEVLRPAGGGGEAAEPPVAYRGLERWVRSFEPVPEPAAGAAPRLAHGGAVLLLGEPGGLLLALAERLARTAGARLALAGPLDPARLDEARSRLLAFDPEPLVFAADLGDEARLGEALRDFEARRGPLRGVVVGDLAADLPLLALTQAGRGTCDLFLHASSRRLDAIGRLLAGRDLDLCLLTATGAGLAGGPGLVLRTAVELTAAGFAEARTEDGPPAWSWLSWGLPDGGAEAESALAAVLAGEPVPQLVAAAGDPLRPPAEAAGELPAGGPAPARMASEAAAGQPGIHPRPALSNPYVAPSTDLERAVVEMWQSLLQLETVGVHDSFFDLGGDSLLGTQVVTRVRETWGVDVPLPALFEAPTPEALARRIESELPAGEEEADKLARVLEQLQNLSAEDVERMLAEREAS